MDEKIIYKKTVNSFYIIFIVIVFQKGHKY